MHFFVDIRGKENAIAQVDPRQTCAGGHNDAWMGGVGKALRANGGASRIQA